MSFDHVVFRSLRCGCSEVEGASVVFRGEGDGLVPIRALFSAGSVVVSSDGSSGMVC